MSKLLALQSVPYIPEEWVCIAFLVLFGLITVFHAFQATFYQTWRFSLAVLLAGGLELAGWGIRTTFATHHSDISAFRSQYSVLFVAPLPLFVATWGTFFSIIPRLGRQFTRSHHSLYIQLIWTMYAITLVLETIGAAEVYNASTIGGRILLAGALIYFALFLGSSVLAIDTYSKYDATKVLDGLEEVYARTRNNKQVRGLFITEVLLFVNTVYRVVDVALLNRNKIMTQEWPLDIFNGLFILFAMIALSIYHPGQFHKERLSSNESNTASPRSSPRMSHKQLPRINTNIIWKPRPQPGQQAPPPKQQSDEKVAPPPSRVIYSGNTKTTPPTL